MEKVANATASNRNEMAEIKDETIRNSLQLQQVQDIQRMLIRQIRVQNRNQRRTMENGFMFHQGPMPHQGPRPHRE